MKRIVALIVLAFVFEACNNQEQQNSEVIMEETTAAETEEVVLTGNFGEEISEEGVVSMEEMLEKIIGTDSVQMKVSGEILTTCKMKGCWMNVALPGDEKMRVTFKDYGFFVPKEGVEGKTVIMEGYAKKATTDVETLKHFAKDAGKSQEEIDAIIEPVDEVTFVASGIVIK